jgi:hypothetical protein
MSSASINEFKSMDDDWELAFNAKIRLWDMDSLINERKNENIVESNNCWFDHLSKVIESAKCIEISNDIFFFIRNKIAHFDVFKITFQEVQKLVKNTQEAYIINM